MSANRVSFVAPSAAATSSGAIGLSLGICLVIEESGSGGLSRLHLALFQRRHDRVCHFVAALVLDGSATRQPSEMIVATCIHHVFLELE